MKKTDRLQQQNQNLKLELENKLIERKLSRIKNKYDATDSANEKKRRRAEIEFQGEDQLHNNYSRLKGINIARDLERNFTNARNLLKQFKLNVIGSDVKIKINTENDNINNAYADWFNGYYAKNCDSRDDMPLTEIAQTIIATVKRDGDILVVFDDFDRDDGRQIFFEADQICNVDAGQWSRQKNWTEVVNGERVPLIQENGVVTDSKGRTVAYIASSKRGCAVVDMSEASIFPTSVCKLIKSPTRFNQKRGIGELLTAANDLEDIYEMRAKELQSAKVASSIAGVVKKRDGIEDAMLSSGIAADDVLDTADPGSAATTELKNYERFESLTGGFMEYLEDEDDFKILDFNRPNINAKDFFEFVLCSAGSALGLSKSYATLTPAGSYTAFRGDMLLAWTQFYSDQKFMERRYFDWLAKKAISWAIRKGKLLRSNLDWSNKISWQFPKMPQVDPLKETNALNNAIKAGFTDFSEILGQNWKNKWSKFANQLQEARELELPLSVFETVSGTSLDIEKEKIANAKDAKNEKN